VYKIAAALHHDGKRLPGMYTSLQAAVGVTIDLVLFSQQMQSRFKAMLEQKTYMNEQLKAILKRNRVLEVGVTPL
jgi:Holliday junction resolvasome RuvABC ATP-dependent DNA helicase subunit